MGDDIEEMSVDVEEEPEQAFSSQEVVDKEIEMGTSWTTLFLDYWFLWLMIAMGAVYIYHKYIAPAIEKYMHALADKELEAKLRKNPDLVIARQEAMLEARRRMQEKHDAEAARMAELRKQREEKKKEEMLSKGKGTHLDGGYSLGGGEIVNPRRKDNPPPRPNRTDYNPLMGSGSGAGYRAPRRSCPGGGCG